MKYQHMHRGHDPSRDYLELIPNEAWRIDYISYVLDDGHRGSSIAIIDVCTSERLAMKNCSSLHVKRVIQVLEELCRVRGVPQLLMCARSGEFSRLIFHTWGSYHRVQIIYELPRQLDGWARARR